MRLAWAANADGEYRLLLCEEAEFILLEEVLVLMLEELPEADELCDTPELFDSLVCCDDVGGKCI